MVQQLTRLVQLTGQNSSPASRMNLEGKSEKYLLGILLTVALKCNTIKRMNPDPPTYNLWIQKVWDVYQMEQITYLLRIQKDTFTKRWSPVIDLLMQ